MILIGLLLATGFSLADYYIFKLLFKSIFEDVDDFIECLKLDLRPDFFSFLKGELGKDWGAEFKLFIFSLPCLIILLFEFILVRLLF